jgi:hypothetical protein
MQHSCQISGQQHRRTAGVTDSPGSVAQVVDVVAALDVEREAHFLPQPVFIQGQRRTVDCFDGHLATIRAPADPAATTITPDLRPVLLAVGAEHKRLIHHCWPDRFAEHRQSRYLAWRQRGTQHRRAAREQAANQGPGIVRRHWSVLEGR